MTASNSSKKFRLKKLLVTFMAALMLLQTSAVSVFAATADGTDYVTADSNSRMPIPKAYVAIDEINNLGGFFENTRMNFFRNPQDIDIDKNDNLYIADTGSNRIIMMNSMCETLAVYTSADGIDFNAPEGLFVDDDGDIYVADTGNKRIVHMANDGTFIESFGNSLYISLIHCNILRNAEL